MHRSSSLFRATAWRCLWPQLLAAALFASWLAGWWQALDEALFWQFDHWLVTSPGWAWAVAVLNQRSLDFLIGGAMAGILAGEFIRRRAERVRLLLAVLAMGATFSLLVALGQALWVPARLSPTLVHQSSMRVSERFPDIPAKDQSLSAFPSDHGIGVLTFLLFALHVFPGRHLWLTVPLLMGALMPRILAGAHWLTDVLCGSLPLVLLAWAWLFRTHWFDRCLARFSRRSTERACRTRTPVDG